MKKFILLFALVGTAIAFGGLLLVTPPKAAATGVLPPITSGSYEIWVDTVNSVITKSGSAVSAISDISGNFRSLGDQSVPLSDPAYNATGIGGTFPSLDFTTSYQQLRTTSNWPDAGNIANTSFYVMVPTTPTTEGGVWGLGTGGGTLTYFGFYLANFAPGWVYNITTGGGQEALSTTVVTNAPHLITTIKSAGALNSTTVIRVDGVTTTISGSSSTGTPNTAASPLYVGTWGDCTVVCGTYTHQSFGAIVITSNALNSTDYTAIENKLNGIFHIF